MSSSDRKSEFLGMPFGTAGNRLKKQLLYKFIRLAGQHFCHKCGFEIESVDDLSIEHVEPWEGRSVDLFWDLDNIAFSHLKCNTPHVRRSGGAKLRKVGPEGTSWCYKCEAFLPVSKFYKDAERFNGYRNRCKECWEHDKTRYASLTQR